MAEAEVLVNWQRQRLAEAEVEKPHAVISVNATYIKRHNIEEGRLTF